MLPIQLVDVLMTEINRGENDKPKVYQLILMHEHSRRAFSIWVGEPEGLAIVLQMNQLPQKRPQTYAFTARLLDAALAKVEAVVIDRLESDIFYATVKLAGQSEQRSVDCRPSDAIALALQAGAPLYASRSVLDYAGFDVPANAQPERRGMLEIAAMLERFAQVDEAQAARHYAKPADILARDAQAERERVLSTVFGITPDRPR